MIRTILNVFVMTQFFIACSSSSVLNFKSTPGEVEIHARVLGKAETHRIGMTPLVIKNTQIRDTIKDEGPLFLIFSKEGFIPQEIMVTDIGSVDLSLNIELKEMAKIAQAEKIDEIITQLFQGHRQVKNGNSDEALQTVKKLAEKYPEVSSIYEFQGSIYYLLKNYPLSHESFATAYKLNPANTEAKRMLKFLKDKLSIVDKASPERPASPTP